MIRSHRHMRKVFWKGSIAMFYLAMSVAAASASCDAAHGFSVAARSIQHSKTVQVEAQEHLSTDGGVWLILFNKGKVAAIARTDFGESGTSTTTYQKISGGLAIKVLVESNDKTFKPTEDVFLQCGDITYFGFPLNYLKSLPPAMTFDPNKTRDELVSNSNELLRAKEIENYVAVMQVH